MVDSAREIYVYARAVLRCAFAVAVVGLFLFLTSDATLEAIEPLRTFGPSTLASLVLDSDSDCVAGPQKTEPIPPSTPRLGGQDIYPSPSDALNITVDPRVLPYRPACATAPIVADWPHTGHWANGGKGIYTPIVIFADLVAHVIVLPLIFGPRGPAIICLMQWVAGLYISQALLILGIRTYCSLFGVKEGPPSDSDNYFILVYFMFGSVFFGTSIVWAFMNGLVALYQLYTPLLPNLKSAAVVSLSSLLFAQCAALRFVLIRLLIASPADSLARRIADRVLASQK